jgi:DNA-binding CsgD family transcriptional regulator
MELWQVVLLGVAIAAMGYALLQGSRRRQRLHRQDPLQEALSEMRVVESSARGIVQELEVRAYDYSREVEARIDNRLAVLDRLILDADREIERLQALLAESRRAGRTDRELTDEEQQKCLGLQESGCTADEIARCLNVSVESVQRALDQWRGPSRRAA